MSMPETAPKTVVGEPLLLIREFSRLSRLSQKALRLYDALGLLEPSLIDPSNGYRYYRSDQLQRASRISVLRQLEMPLQRIAEVLELEGTAAAAAVAVYWHEIETQHHEKRGLVQYLIQVFEDKELPMFEILTRQVPAQKIASINGRVFQPQIASFIGQSMNQLYSSLGQAGVTPVGAPFVAYYGKVDADSDGPLEVCVAFTGSLEPSENIVIRIEPAHQEAYVVCPKGLVKSLPDLLHAYDAVAKWLHDNNKHNHLPCREVYFGDWDNIGDQDPAFDIAYPYTDQA
jgi:DNA-binding transcriptional MerR regulator